VNWKSATSLRNHSVDSHPSEWGHITKICYLLTERRRHDEIRSLYIDRLASVLVEDSTAETTHVSVDKKIDSFVEGDLQHAAEILSALWEIASKVGGNKTASNTPTVSPFPFLSGVLEEGFLCVTRPRGSGAPHTGLL